MRSVSTTLATAIADPLGLKFVPRLVLYLDTGTVVWTWDDAATPVLFNIGAFYSGSALDPASIEVTLYSASATAIGSSTIEQAALGAAAPFRGKRITLELMCTTTAGTESLTIFDGHVTQVKADTTGVTLQATGAMSSADQRQGTMPVELQCPWVVYSAECGASVVTANLTTTSGSTTTDIHVASVGTARVNDLVTMANGETALVRGVASGVLTLDRPVTAPASGLTVVLKRGCRKYFADCMIPIRFGGSPWRPLESIMTGG
jgi:hypothetical protein